MGILASLFQKKPRLTYERPAGWSEESVQGGTFIFMPTSTAEALAAKYDPLFERFLSTMRVS